MSNDHLSSLVCCVSDAAVTEASEASLLRGPMSVMSDELPACCVLIDKRRRVSE